MKRLYYLIFLGLLFLQHNLDAQTLNADRMTDVVKMAERLGFEGSVMISQDGKTLFQKAFGLSNREKGIPNSIASLYNYASMGKMFTGLAIMQLVEKDLLLPGDRLIDVLPDYPNREIAEKITIHQLLTHTSGVTGLFRMSSDQKLSALKDYLPLFVEKDLEFSPGTKMSYSNAGYLILGLVIEKLSDMTYFDYLNENIFKPANMLSVGFDHEKAPEEFVTHYTAWRGSEEDDIEVVEYGHDGNSAGGGYAGVQSFIRFGEALLDGKLLKPESVELLLAGYSDGRGRGRYSYGFFVNEHQGLKLVGHGGGGPGVNGEFQIFKNKGIVISILSNYDPHKATFLKDAITGLFLQWLDLLPEPQLDGTTRFELQGHDNANIVLLQGAFTDGNLFKYPLKYQAGKWITSINLPAGTHYYRFIVDGESIPDPKNNDSRRVAGGLIVSKITVN